MKISVVTTCLNSQRTISQTIESVLSQQGDFELEYIVTDAGSTDSTLEIIAQYGSRIRLLDARGTNQSAGINIGLREASGDVVAFLNADDIYRPGALATVAESFKSCRDKVWLVGGCSIIDDTGREFHSLITAYKRFLLRNYRYSLLLIENFICQPAVFWRRDVLQRVGYLSEGENLVMDYDYWLRIARVGGAPIVVNSELAGFRRIEGTKSNTSYMRQFKDDLRVAFASAKLSVRYWWTIPLKVLGYMRTVLIYRCLYR